MGRDTKLSAGAVVAAVGGDDGIELHLKPQRLPQGGALSGSGSKSATLPSGPAPGQRTGLAPISCCSSCQTSRRCTAASLGRGGAPHLRRLQKPNVGYRCTPWSRDYGRLGGFATFRIVDAEPQVEGDEPEHGPRVCPHGQGAFLPVQQRKQRRDVRQPASCPPVGQKPVVMLMLGALGTSVFSDLRKAVIHRPSSTLQ